MPKNNPLTIKDLEDFKSSVIRAVDQMMDEKLKEKLDPVYVLLNHVLKEIQDFREESTILRGDHDRVLTLEDEMDVMKKIHPDNAHKYNPQVSI